MVFGVLKNKTQFDPKKFHDPPNFLPRNKITSMDRMINAKLSQTWLAAKKNDLARPENSQKTSKNEPKKIEKPRVWRSVLLLFEASFDTFWERKPSNRTRVLFKETSQPDSG